MVMLRLSDYPGEHFVLSPPGGSIVHSMLLAQMYGWYNMNLSIVTEQCW